jgi:flagellar biosynthesis component FlhA
LKNLKKPKKEKEMATAINHVTVMRLHLEGMVKKTITEALVKKQLAGYEKELRSTIKGIVEQISFNHIEKMVNPTLARDEYALWIKWNNEDSKLIEKEEI